jgi:hypothetical protein
MKSVHPERTLVIGKSVFKDQPIIMSVGYQQVIAP